MRAAKQRRISLALFLGGALHTATVLREFPKSKVQLSEIPANDSAVRAD